MGISTFPAASGGGSVNNDFVVDMNDSTNNTAELGRQYIAGAYSITLSSGDTSFDVYLLDADGALVGYSNSGSVVASDGFETVVILGVGTTEVVSFTFTGAVADTSSAGNEVAAGAYLTSINPSDLPTADDTANVVGGNFATDVQFFFESGTVSLPAKNIVRSNSTALIVTRPDVFDPALDPWDVRAVNPGVVAPTGSNAHILAGTVDAGAAPVWVTTSPLTTGFAGAAYAGTVVATDADGAVTYSITAGALPTGLGLNPATGVISGTPTASGQTFTVQALDDGGNSNTREFSLPIQLATGGSVTSTGGYTYHVFTSSGDFVALTDIASLEYLVVGGGGAGGQTFSNFGAPAGAGGAGGLRNSFAGETSGSASATESAISVTAGTVAVTIGAGGNADRSFQSSPSNSNSGSSSSFGNLVTTSGGGRGASITNNQYNASGGSSGGSGGGAFGVNTSANGGNGTSGQGFSGGNAGINDGGTGGGALSAGTSSGGGTSGGTGLSSTDGTAVTNLNIFAEGGGVTAYSGIGNNGLPNSGSGGWGASVNPYGNSQSNPGGNGGSGIVIVRY